MADEAAAELLLLAAAMRFCDFQPDASHPALPLMQQIWPLLQQLVSMYQHHAAIMEATCKLYEVMMLSGKQLLVDLLPAMMETLAVGFQQQPSPAIVDCVKQTVELFGGEIIIIPSLSNVLVVMTAEVCKWLERGQEQCLGAVLELLTHFFELAHRYLVFSVAAILPSPVLPQLLQCAASCITHQEFQHTRAALTFLCLVLSGNEAAQPFVQHIEVAVVRHGCHMVEQIMLGVVAESPPNLLDHLSEALRVIIESFPDRSTQWLFACVQSSQKLPKECWERCGQQLPTFLNLLTKQPALPQDQFHSLMHDFSGVCRGQIPTDQRMLQQYTNMLQQ